MADEAPAKDDNSLYAGRWVAKIGQRIVAQGGTPEQARVAAKAACFKETSSIHYVASQNELIFPELVQQIRSIVQNDIKIFLVGGAVRDALLKREIHDLDFVLPSEAMRVGRIVSNALGGAFFALDEQRQIARVIYQPSGGKRWVLDFALQRGENLTDDLVARDFTANALAIDLHNPQQLLDPLAGATDILNKRLRACSILSIKADPVRILRGLRLAVNYSFTIMPDTRKLMRQGVQHLDLVTPERVRDEVFRIFSGVKPAAIIKALDVLGGLEKVFPEISQQKGVTQTAPHVENVLHHTLSTVQNLESVLQVLGELGDKASAQNLWSGILSIGLGRYRKKISEHLSEHFTPERTRRSLLFLAALYHDAGKPYTRTIENDQRVRFLGHECVGAELSMERARLWNLSNEETRQLSTIVKNHLRPFHLAQRKQKLSRRIIYRYFRDCGSCGVDICLLALADVLSTYAATLTSEIWTKYVDVIRELLESWWEFPGQRIKPPPLINGDDLLVEFELDQGPLIGELLEAVREKQAEGRIQTRQQALSHVREIIRKKA